MFSFCVKDDINDADVVKDLCKTHSCKSPFCSQQNPPLLFISHLSIEGFFIELNLREKKWLLCCSYSAHKNET